MNMKMIPKVLMWHDPCPATPRAAPAAESSGGGGDDGLSSDERLEIYRSFHDRVNMAPKELEAWLESEESKSVGWTREGESEAIGHKSGRRIVEIKRSKKDELDEDDYRHMRKVVNYIKRHTAQGPQKSDPEDSKWRYSLMNWGHDPLKDA